MPHGVAGGTAERRGRRVFRNEAMIFFLADGERIVEAPLSLEGGSPTFKIFILKGGLELGVHLERGTPGEAKTGARGSRRARIQYQGYRICDEPLHLRTPARRHAIRVNPEGMPPGQARALFCLLFLFPFSPREYLRRSGSIPGHFVRPGV